jgi:hypothetical protein
MMRRSTLFLIALSAAGLCFSLAFLQALLQSRADLPALLRDREMVERLGLTDLALFTEARYMRNPSQTDLHSAFQDHPVSLEHFPTGSFGGGAGRRGGGGIKRSHGTLD